MRVKANDVRKCVAVIAAVAAICLLLPWEASAAGMMGGGMGGGGCGGGGGSTVIDPPVGAVLNDPVPATNVSTTPGVVEVNLRAQMAQISVNGAKANLMTYNGCFPGPLIRAKRGDTLKVNITNGLPYSNSVNFLGFQKNFTNLHTHGLHVSPQDPQDFVMYTLAPGETYHHAYDLSKQEPGTLNLYHPHQHGLVAEQFWAGLCGPIVIDDDIPALSGLETHVLMLKDLSLSGSDPAPHSSMMDYMNGKEGNIVMVNGQVNPRLYIKNGQVMRLKIANVSNARFYMLSIEGHTMQVIGADSRLLDKPYSVTQLLISPAERVDILVKGTKASGSYKLKALPYSRGGCGGMGGGGCGGGGAQTVTLMTFTYSGTRTPAQSIPAMINPNAKRIDPTSVMIAAERTLTLSMSMSRGYINGQDFDVDPYMVHSTVNTYEKWTFINQSGMDHPLHQHVNSAQVLSVTGGDPGYASLYTTAPAMKDVIIVPKGGSATVLVPIMDFSGMCMIHCHILEHEDIGMMAMWMIMEAGMPM